MIRPLVTAAALVFAGGLSQFATPLAISAQDAGTIRAHATVISADAAWEAHRAGQTLAGEAVAHRGGETVRGSGNLPADELEATGGGSVLASFDESRSQAGEGAATSVSERSADPERPVESRDVRITVAHVAY